MWWVYISCFLLYLSAVSCEPVIKTAKGKIRGQILKSRYGRDYYSFTGIPYAKPPVGELRFQPPVEIDPWEGIWDAINDPKICVQNNHFFPIMRSLIHGQEDCLYLNIFTPDLNKKLPVMFWIHGGGFLAGHSAPDLYGPDYFMDKDVVFVSFNYRLGLFGFISTEDDVIPGNYGMKDQVMVLRWVRENIANFGGDPEQVTIFGESAGGASTGYHLLSPMSKGLFQKAILQSGTPLCCWALSSPGIIRKRTEAVATIAGCYANSSLEILNCLKKIPAFYLVELHNKLFEWINNPSILFPPVVESCNSNQEAFLCNHPITEFKQESNVPTIIGLNSGEGGLFVANLYNETSLLFPELQTDFNRLLGSLLTYKHLSLPEHWDEIGDRIMTKYFPSGKIDDHLSTVNMLGEGTFLPCVYSMALKLSSPSYIYLFDYQNEFSFNQFYGECKKPLGVSHGDEMISMFPLKVVNPNGLNERDEEVSKLIIDIWVKFASSKTLTIDGKDDGKAWPEFKSIEKLSVLHIDSARPKLVQNPFAEKYKFWNELPLFSRLKQFTSKPNVKYEL
ncbi:Carboxylesterase type B, conserved site,Carboxylesterase, type B,Carboxylesterase type B [Cinara cedri]|uniref:Carboxylic ester hydrolase n=1 Tax=Cinara cedri TaxID=506608 RepID=A0A5E4NJ73_9HEMI|nr:Carboxylesterase type B, conserved site,Carboxylesterase, type B,Carboxylesterase type B [Cinara cedri]